jgi:gamma-D-glutamyl-L-lysine dipeptidyl-peptidase
MESGICLLSTIPVRSQPSHKSEMVTQVLFGELYEIADSLSSWVKIKLLFDGYEGWIEHRQVNKLDEREFQQLAGSETSITINLVHLLANETNGSRFPVVIGSSLPGFADSRIHVGREIYFYDGLISEKTHNDNRVREHNSQKLSQRIVPDAMLFLNTPYLWGGRSPFGIDCSGFVQMVYKLSGLKLYRDASQQASQGEVISLLAESVPGDLAFFDDEEGNITHVGMLIDQHRIIHSSGMVRIDTIDHHGIFNIQLQCYTHKLRLIRRII